MEKNNIEKQSAKTPEISFILSFEDAVNHVRKEGYLLLEDRDKEELGIDQGELSNRMTQEGFEQANDGVYFDPARIELKTVNEEHGLDPVYEAEGWKVVARKAGYATLAKNK